MIFGGLQKLTTLDFPGVVSALVFTRGCNFFCPYCHNKELIPRVERAAGDLDQQAVLDFLEKRRKVLDGLVISGGEPCLQQGVEEFCVKVRALGYKIKLDSNGSLPEVLERILSARLADYIALDLKTLPEMYSRLCGLPDIAERFLRSLELTRASGVPFELRTTCVEPFVTPDILKALAGHAGQAPWFLQKARLDAADEEKYRIRAVPAEEVARCAAMLTAMGCAVAVR